MIVTTTSSRGVGLRVVRDVLVDLGGGIEIQTGGSVERQARDQALEHELQGAFAPIVGRRGL